MCSSAFSGGLDLDPNGLTLRFLGLVFACQRTGLLRQLIKSSFLLLLVVTKQLVLRMKEEKGGQKNTSRARSASSWVLIAS